MDRRLAIMAILSAAMSGDPLSDIVTREFAPGLEKYGELIHLQLSVIATHKATLNETREVRGDAISPLMNDMMRFMRENFTGGDITGDEAFRQVQTMFDGSALNSLDVETLQRFMEVVIPVAVMRCLLSRHRVTFNPSKVKEWDTFADTYCDVILRA